jgi:hypothetical protein
MALIVEDGTGFPDADSYASVADADAYFASMGNTQWGAASNANKESALRRATQYLDTYYNNRWQGLRTYARDQALAWPRYDVYDDEDNLIANDEIPKEIVQATMEAALRELTNPNSLTPDVTVGRIVKKRTVGPISTEYEGRGDPVRDARPVITKIEEILAPLIMQAQIYTGQAARG